MSEPKPPVVVLDKSQLADNIGAVARVMANFGLSDLRLVNPRDGWPQDRAWAAASGADWVLEGVKVFGSVAEAVADLNTVFATTARPRETRLPVRTPRESARLLYDDAASGLRVGLLFGGDVNRRFRAFDQKSGKVLWETNLGAPVAGYPISYAVDGKQYILASTGGSLSAGGLNALTPEIKPGTSNAIFVFALD